MHGNCAHSRTLHCNQKAYGVCWLRARLAGWDGGTGAPTATHTAAETVTATVTSPPTATSRRAATPTVTNQPPRAGTFEPHDGSGATGEYEDFITTCVDPDGHDDITRADFLLDQQPPISSDGVTAAYVQPENTLWLKDGGFCRPGQAWFLSANYITLDCAHTTVSGDGDTLSINWHVRLEQCLDGSCGWNRAYELVSDSAGLRDMAMVGAVAAGRDKQLTQDSRRVCRLAGRALAGG